MGNAHALKSIPAPIVLPSLIDLERPIFSVTRRTTLDKRHVKKGKGVRKLIDARILPADGTIPANETAFFQIFQLSRKTSAADTSDGFGNLIATESLAMTTKNRDYCDSYADFSRFISSLRPTISPPFSLPKYTTFTKLWQPIAYSSPKLAKIA